MSTELEWGKASLAELDEQGNPIPASVDTEEESEEESQGTDTDTDDGDNDNSEEDSESDTDDSDDDSDYSDDDDDVEDVEDDVEADDTEDESEEDDVESEITDQEEEPEEEETEESPAPDISEITEGVFETEDELKATASLLKDNPQLKAMLDYFSENGTLEPWLQATQIDYDQISDDQLIRMDIISEFQDAGVELTSEEAEELIADEMDQRYFEQSEEEKDKRVGSIKKKMHAAKLRNKLKAEQEKFVLPKKEKEDTAAKEAELKRVRDERLARLNKHMTKNIKDGKMKVKFGDQDYTVSVSPREIQEIANGDVRRYLVDSEGNVDLTKLTFVKNPQAFISQLTSTIEANAKAAVLDQINNKQKRKSKGTSPKSDRSKPFDENDASTWKNAKIVKQ